MENILVEIFVVRISRTKRTKASFQTLTGCQTLTETKLQQNSVVKCIGYYL